MTDLESLYPFLYGGQSDTAVLMSQVVASTVEKAKAIVALRDRIGQAMAPELLHCAVAMAARLSQGGRVFTMGNGGSATDAEALSQLFVSPPWGPAHPAMCLTSDMAVVTALSNDVGYDLVFARQLVAQSGPHDILVGLSTSGNSDNLLQAFDRARLLGLLTVGLAGAAGGKMAETASIAHLFVVPSDSIHRIQEAQTTLYHMLWELTQSTLNPV